MRLSVTVLLLAGAAVAQAPLKPAAIVEPAVKPAVSNQTITQLERRLDNKISSTGGTDPMLLLGPARVLYLPGFGAIVTQEVSLVVAPVISPFQLQIPADQAVKVHQRKLEHVPLLKQAMREMWADAATTLGAVPETEQMVLAIRLLYQPWENTAGLPAQVVMRGERKPALANNLQMEEQ
ncbi:MAG: hypothetical protein LAP40_18270 [Acidobacteriia bacterium]|nr:hypothetical protein [Terriglobia bacterium]